MVTPRRELDQVLQGATDTREVWTGVWTSADGRSGYSVATRSRPGEVDVIVDGNVTPGARREERAIETTRWIPAGPELVCVDALTKAGSKGHGTRLGKATAELSVHECNGIRERGLGDARAWFVELPAR